MQQHKRPAQDGPAVVLIVSDEPDPTPFVRAGQREVRRWSADGTRPDTPEHARWFSGDPTDRETYRWAESASGVTAVIELRDVRHAQEIAAAVRAVRDDAAVLILCDGCDAAAADGTVARAGRLRDVLRVDLDDELQGIEAQRRVFCLRRFAEDAAVIPILAHADPDADAVSSALAVRTLLRRPADTAPIVTLEEITRPENRRMTELLNIRVTKVTLDELRGFERIIVVDSQPVEIAGGNTPRFAVIDHHPFEAGYRTEYRDIRPGLGATATMLTQYLQADDPRRVNETVATALLYGIKTDTNSLTRGVTPADVDAYAFLQSRADLGLLRRFERGAYSHAAARSFGEAIARARVAGDVIVASPGTLEPNQVHMLTDLADFCLGVEGVTWAIACAFAGDSFILSIRYQGAAGASGAGGLARRLSGNGSGGGHASMARVEWSLAEARYRLRVENDDALIESVLELVSGNVE